MLRPKLQKYPAKGRYFSTIVCKRIPCPLSAGIIRSSLAASATRFQDMKRDLDCSDGSFLRL